MLLIIFLGLIAKLALGSDECDLGTPKMEDFDCNKVGIRVWHTFYNKQRLPKSSAGVYIPFTVSLTKSQKNISDCTSEQMNELWIIIY